ncbi:sushi, von Willebrand factor type A, EGF and pentraxin domain-containing protein 1-like [Ruditapes philippinarum]|uniref:sushi, von Willebrand factor type A, EGF and pentraxin domain-containing protein 1-like n=1 Tax=Ruditapes philippinarum TaxID=129788 RepID=UPI00295A80DF|nr:sushi, von Willebrand factor type A, EGF and pentraxin domain-containing protein 1-like [Ruditapes philippinarum]
MLLHFHNIISVLCDNVITPQNGAFTSVTDGETSTVVFTCDEGFTLKGTSDVTCAVSGKYEASEPTCSQCDILIQPESGTMTTSTNGTITVVTFDCSSGYHLHGDSSLSCGTDGTWNGSEPECRCDLPPSITNGYYNISSNGSDITYTCLEGFTINGEKNQVCQSNGLGWDSVQPLCVECGSLNSPENGSIELSSDGSVTSAEVSCAVGTSLVGEPNIECTDTGIWSVSAFTCETCEDISAPENGNIAISTNGTMSVANFQCNTGYTLSGSEVSTCNLDGTWSSSPPNCVKCPTVGDVDNGDVSATSDGLSTSILYTCHSNYIIKGSELLVCRSDGSWNDSIPTCVCDPPLSLVDGNYTISADGMTLTYRCDVGFSMVGSNVRTCATDSSGWSGFPPTCNKCEDISSIADGDVLITTNGSTSSVTYTCYLGYSVSSDYSATCDEDGHWDISAPTCLQCPSIESIQSGIVSESTNGTVTTAVYECLTDYYIVGDTIRQCKDGTWSGAAPVCLCSSSLFFANGVAQSNGSVISYTCDSGYSLNGATERVCQDNGLGWSLTEPSCEKCDLLSVPTGGNVTISTDGSVTKASISCMTGYTMSGISTLTCGSDGSWDIQTPSCGVPCSALGSPTGGHVTVQSDGSTTTAVYECYTNYTLNGPSQLTCRSDGSWDFLEPTCVQCGVITSPTNGYVYHNI